MFKLVLSMNSEDYSSPKIHLYGAKLSQNTIRLLPPDKTKTYDLVPEIGYPAVANTHAQKGLYQHKLSVQFETPTRNLESRGNFVLWY